MAVDISESRWKAFTKKQKLAVDLDDKELLKALARFDKTDERKPEPRLETLKDLAREIPKQVTALVKLKKQLGDKPFGLVKDELYAILEEAEALQKKTQAALDAEEEEDEDEDEDSVPSALVNPKLLLRQLTMCRKDPERTMKFAFVDAKGKEQPAMLAMHPRMGARALFTKLQAAAGVKTGAYGTAWVDGMSLMLQLDKPLSGLVKKVRAPVKASGFRITKAVLWNADGTVFEQDELAEEAVGDDPGKSTTPPAPPKPSATYEAKLAALKPRIETAAAEGGPDVPKHAKLLDFATTKANAEDFLGAVAALRQIEQLLDKPTPKTTTGGGVDPAAAFVARFTALLPKLKTAALEIKAIASEAGIVAKNQKDYDKAGAMLDEVERRLAAGARSPGATVAESATDAETTDTTQPEDDHAATWQRRFETTEPVYLQVMAGQPADASRLRAVMDFANGKAEAKQYAAASQALDRLDGMLAKLPAAAPATTKSGGNTKLVAYRKTLLDMRKAVATVDAQIDALKAAIPGSAPDENELADELADALHELTEDLLDAVDEAMNAADDEAAPVNQTAVGEIDRFLRDLQTNALVKHVDDNKFGVKVSIASTLGSALTAVRKAMPVPA